MKLKPLHYVLIAILVVETIVFSVLTFTKDKPAVLHELSITYENVDGIYTLESIFDDTDFPSFDFERAGIKYTFNGSAIDYTDYYEDHKKFLEKYPDTSDMVWRTYQQEARRIALDAVATNSDIIEHLQAIASSWYSVDDIYIPDSAIYTIVFTDTYTDWVKAFKQCEVNIEGTIPSEMVLPADVLLNGKAYPAIAYMSVYDDAVRTHIMFGDEYIDDFSNSVAEIIICSSDKSLAYAHAYIPTSFAASTVESRYRQVVKE